MGLMVYDVSLATAGNLTTSGTANTETETLFVKPGANRNVSLAALYLQGKAAGLTALSGIIARIIKWGTSSTAGTSITPQPKDPGMQAAKATAASRPTPGTTRTNRVITGCSISGPGGWVAWNPDAWITMEAGNAGSISVNDASGLASANFEFSAEIVE
jgi:hypothetical protein